MPTPLLTPTLAQQLDWNRVIVWVVVLVGLAIVGAIVLVVIRKTLLSDGASPPPVGFGLRELEAMRDRGELTDEEYQRARSRMVSRLTGEEATEPDEVPMDVVPDPPPPDPDDTPDNLEK